MEKVKSNMAANWLKHIGTLSIWEDYKKLAGKVSSRIGANLKNALAIFKGGNIVNRQFYKQAISSIRRPASQPPQVRKMQLGGQEFDIVNEGLAPEQVAGFITQFINKHKDLEEQHNHFLSLAALSEKAAVEADKAAKVVKDRIKNEADAEAARIIAEANAESQEMLIQALDAAREITRQQVENIHQAALKEAAITRIQAKQQAQLFLIRNRDTLESDLKHEVKESYNRLLFYLQELFSKGNDLEAQWKDKTQELCKNEAFELEDYDMESYVLASETVKPFLQARDQQMPGNKMPKGAGDRATITI